MSPGASSIRVRWYGCRDYAETLARMQAFARDRTPGTCDEIWCMEHPPVYTLGIRGARQHLMHPGEIPVVASDRGGQVTYHGPGQLLVYPLLDLARRGLRMRQLIEALEQATIAALAAHDIPAQPGTTPGVFVDHRKIASIGLRVRRHCTYHGLALNVCNDLAPFRGINPCGFAGLEMTSLAALGKACSTRGLAHSLVPALLACLGGQAVTTPSPPQPNGHKTT